jgi:hypothetical protein
MYLNRLGKVNLVRQIMKYNTIQYKCIHTIINREVKEPIELDWRTEHVTVHSEIIELGSIHAPPTLEANTLDKAVDGDVTGMGLDYVSLASPESRVSTFDKHTRRKPVMRSSNFLWED